MDVFVARQPIFDKNQIVYGYELLYRSNTNNYYSCLDGDKASKEVIVNSFLLIGLDVLTRGKFAFINFTKKLLEEEVATMLPKNLIVVEVLENIDPDKKILQTCSKLKEMGYKLALDDFIYKPEYQNLIELADIIKVDFMNTNYKERNEIIKQVDKKNVTLLAEKIETHNDFEEALSAGYSYFQGYFFSKPRILSSKEISPVKLTYFKLLYEVNKTELDYDHIEKIIEMDLSLSYKLLKFINSAYFGFRSKVNCIRQALTILGKKGINRWISLLALKQMSHDKPDEILITAITRGKFCEYLSEKIEMKNEKSDFFLIGMFSLLDALFEKHISEILDQLPVTENIENALLGRESIHKDIFQIVLSFEKADWEKCLQLGAKYNLNVQDIGNNYISSLEFSKNVFDDIS